MEKRLGFELEILTPPSWIVFSLVAIFLVSIISFFFSWKVAVSGLAFSIFGFWIADLTANTIALKDIEELVKKMVRNNYLQTRRKQGTFNKNEIEKVLTDWFNDALGYEKGELTRNTKFM